MRITNRYCCYPAPGTKSDGCIYLRQEKIDRWLTRDDIRICDQQFLLRPVHEPKHLVSEILRDGIKGVRAL